MYYKNILKKILILFFIFSLHSLIGQEKSGFYGVITNIFLANSDSRNPILYNNNEQKELKINDKVYSGNVILTSDSEEVELCFYNNNVPIAFLIIGENTDLEINYGSQFDLKLTFGRCRIVNNTETIHLLSKTVKSIIRNSDFGFESILKEGKTTGYFIVFDGSVQAISLKSPNITSINTLEVCEFTDFTLSEKKSFKREELYSWQASMLSKSQNIPDLLNLMLEKLIFKQKTIVEEQEATTDVVVKKDVTTDIVKQTIKPKNDFRGLLSFEFGGLGYKLDSINSLSKNIGIKFVYNPTISLLDNKLEFSFYLNLNFFPAAIGQQEPWDMFGSINYNTKFINREWSFGTDQGGFVPKVIFDVFDDIFSKIKTIRVNNEEDTMFFKVGEYSSISDPLHFTFFNFNSKYFNLLQRKTSLVTMFNLKYFKAFIYAEDILPKGLYGGTITLLTPNESFRLRFILNGFVDCYDLIKYDGNTFILPSFFSANIIFDTFNTASFGLFFFFNGGINIPFYSNTQSNFSEMLTSGLIFSFGSSIRFKDVTFSMEFVKDSKIAKVGNFDISYTYSRDKKITDMSSWFNLTTKRTSFNEYFSDHYFGLRLKLNYSFLKHVIFDFSGQIGFSANLSSANLPTSLNDIYDRIYLRLAFDSLDKWKVGFNLYIIWNIDNLYQAITKNNFIGSNLGFLGFGIRPHKALEINAQTGMTPISNNLAFFFDINFVFRPLYFYTPPTKDSKQKVNKTNTKTNTKKIEKKDTKTDKNKK
ncbi:MAG: hypothetical protein A2086_13025 [Spirochaetes bacterium GWD1_27_9]|nr:MAG: hypothetical protein A2086_13025 [Spirochaetes bacterium GWD1_27_9]